MIDIELKLYLNIFYFYNLALIAVLYLTTVDFMFFVVIHRILGDYVSIYNYDSQFNRSKPIA